MSATPLQRRLAGGTAERPTALDAFSLARRTFQDGQRLDMQALAAELRVNRATLYRWVGSRELLLREVIWSLTERTLARPPDGAPLAETLTRFVHDVLAHPGMHRFLAEEGEFALRLLTMRAGGYQQRLIALVHEMIDAEIAAGLLHSPVPVDDLAYTVVRVVESYVYLEVITGEEPDGDRAGRVLRALLPTTSR
ncbi:QsdR family transcriptional regulator [Pseudonocardia abyssalis]|uniref:TetR/AcrR family transcriptional regulator n=1 Tax=Pseudonocardia abyssalis TaxID=2792008 RepID=A0ABS6UZZ2_9PSEU|nr:QsdR family transcriptional regulator [Pseudonocardia abyssalis]MBW0137823.1 TetR/AcrR family transcriptional regulator [Pseudonocardia abyssalis]